MGPSFKDTHFFTFLVICPQAIDKLVEVEDPDPTDIVVNLPEQIVPFTVQVALWNKCRIVTIPNPLGEFLGGGVVTLQIDGLDYGLVFMFPRVILTPDAPAKFPARTCYLLR